MFRLSFARKIRAPRKLSVIQEILYDRAVVRNNLIAQSVAGYLSLKAFYWWLFVFGSALAYSEQ